MKPDGISKRFIGQAKGYAAMIKAAQTEMSIKVISNYFDVHYCWTTLN